jgi:hypothetical protein
MVRDRHFSELVRVTCSVQLLGRSSAPTDAPNHATLTVFIVLENAVDNGGYGVGKCGTFGAGREASAVLAKARDRRGR